MSSQRIRIGVDRGDSPLLDVRLYDGNRRRCGDGAAAPCVEARATTPRGGPARCGERGERRFGDTRDGDGRGGLAALPALADCAALGAGVATTAAGVGLTPRRRGDGDCGVAGGAIGAAEVAIEDPAMDEGSPESMRWTMDEGSPESSIEE